MAIYGFCENKCKHELNTIVISPTEPTSNEKVWIQKGKNLFNKDTSLIGYWVKDGNPEYTGDVSTNVFSDYIKVNPNTTYTISGYVLGKWISVHGYNKNKTWNKQIASTNTLETLTFTTGESDHYIRVAFSESQSRLDLIQIELGLTATEYEAHTDKEAIYVKNNNGIYEEVYIENKGNILWANPNPKESMAYTESITLSSSDYDELEFWYFASTTNTNLMCVKTKAGYGVALTNIDSYVGNMFSRTVGYNSKTSYKINACYAYGKDYATPPSEANTNLIPAFIIGYKNS